MFALLGMYNTNKAHHRGEMQLSIYTLGTLGFAIDNVPIHNFASDKARGLLAYLAVESGRPHSRESLAGLFWAEYPENRARSNLSQTLYSLRQVIGDRDTSLPFLAVSRQSIEFNKVSDLWVDVKKLSTISTIENEPCGENLNLAYRCIEGTFSRVFPYQIAQLLKNGQFCNVNGSNAESTTYFINSLIYTKTKAPTKKLFTLLGNN